MAQHPIPQQISSYEFKLVGEMTLKQFFKAGGGIGAALLINSSKLFWLVKWPLMLSVAGLGLALAFFPYQERPLEYWITSFIKSIFSPTIYLYQKGKKKQQTEGVLIDSAIEKKKDAEWDGKVRLINEKGKIKDFINSLPSMKLNIKIKEGSAKDEAEIRKEKKKLLEEKMKKEIEIIDLNAKPSELGKEEADWKEQKADLNLKKADKLEATGKALFGEIPMPDIPEIPNLIVGMVTNKEGKIVEGAIVEIQDEHGNPARVLKTNSLGQFKIASPLQNGKYLIICEKENFNFDRVDIDLSGKIVQPIKIISN